MEERLKEMDEIMTEKERDTDAQEPHPLDPEGITMARRKRLTFDIVDTPVDPLR